MFSSKAAQRPPGMTWDRAMFFLLRITFWLGLVCLLLPSGGKSDPDAHISATQAATLASAAVSDMRGFCERQPTACKVGGKVAVALGHKAEAGARTLIGFVTTKMGDQGGAQESGSAVRSAANSIANTAAKPLTTAAIDHGTLKAADLRPAFHTKVPLPPRRAVPRRLARAD